LLETESLSLRFLWLADINSKKREQYAGKQIRRSLFRTADGVLINADVNGAYNIITKAFPKGIEGVVVHPVRVLLS
jgi:putative transposase